MDAGAREDIVLSERSDSGEEDAHTVPDEESPLITVQSLGTVSFRESFLESVRRLCANTATVSMIAKPSHDRRASAFIAGWNVSNLIQGTGILGIPYGVLMGGWAGVASLVVVAWMCCFTGKILIECLYETSKRSGQRKRVRANYPEVGGAVWPRWGNNIVSVIQVCEMFGGTIMYIVLLATIFTDLFKSITPLKIYHWAIICTYVALPLAFVRRVSIIAWFSMVSVFALMSGMLTIIIYCITQYQLMSIQKIPPFNFENFPVGFGIIVFSYTAHAVFPGVESSMKEPNKYPMMMNGSFTFAAIIKVLLGLFAVLVFGDSTDQVITVNMKSSYVFNILANTFVISNVFLAFPINQFVILETIDAKFLGFFPHLGPERRYHWVWLILTRTLILTFALFLVILVPHFALVMGFVGSFTGTCMCFLFPCYFHIKLKWNELHWYDIALRWFIIVFGIVCGGLGVFFSGKRLIEASNQAFYKHVNPRVRGEG